MTDPMDLYVDKGSQREEVAAIVTLIFYLDNMGALSSTIQYIVRVTLIQQELRRL